MTKYELISLVTTYGVSEETAEEIAEAIETLEEARKILDAVEGRLTRCKYCKHYNPETKGCKRNPSVEPWEENDFCSYGESDEE